MRTLAPPAAAGWEYVTSAEADLAREVARDPGAARRQDQGAVGPRRRLRPRHRRVQPLPHDPRVDRARHRARPGPRLRGGVRGNLLRDVRQARHVRVRLPRHERHRRPRHRLGPGQRRLGRRGRRRTALGHRQGRDPRRVPDRPRDGRPQGPRPEQRRGVCGQRPPRAAPADGQRESPARPGGRDAGRPRRAGRERHLHRRRQVVVDRHAALQLPVHGAAVLRDRERAPVEPAARRGLPGHDDRLLAVDGGGRRAVDVLPGRRAQLRQGPARAGLAGQPRDARRALFRGVRILNTVQEGGR